jgi:hypothetical protein
VLTLYYYEGLTLEEVARVLGVTDGKVFFDRNRHRQADIGCPIGNTEAAGAEYRFDTVIPESVAGR